MRPSWDEMYAQQPLRIVGTGKREGPKGGKHYVEQCGYAAPPGTGPEGETCRSCKHLTRIMLGNTYRKCSLMQAYWTGGAKTDVLAKSPACAKWEKRAEGSL